MNSKFETGFGLGLWLRWRESGFDSYVLECPFICEIGYEFEIRNRIRTRIITQIRGIGFGFVIFVVNPFSFVPYLSSFTPDLTVILDCKYSTPTPSHSVILDCKYSTPTPSHSAPLRRIPAESWGTSPTPPCCTRGLLPDSRWRFRRTWSRSRWPASGLETPPLRLERAPPPSLPCFVARPLSATRVFMAVSVCFHSFMYSFIQAVIQSVSQSFIHSFGKLGS